MKTTKIQQSGDHTYRPFYRNSRRNYFYPYPNINNKWMNIDYYLKHSKPQSHPSTEKIQWNPDTKSTSSSTSNTSTRCNSNEKVIKITKHLNNNTLENIKKKEMEMRIELTKKIVLWESKNCQRWGKDFGQEVLKVNVKLKDEIKLIVLRKNEDLLMASKKFVEENGWKQEWTVAIVHIILSTLRKMTNVFGSRVNEEIIEKLKYASKMEFGGQKE